MLKIKSIFIGVVLVFLSTISVHAGFGISPTDIQNRYLKPGLKYEQEFTLSRTDTSEDLVVKIEVDMDEIESWFSFSPSKTFNFPEGVESTTFKVTIDVPETASYRKYNGALRLVASGQEREVAGVSIVQGVRVDVDVDVTEDDHKEVVIESVRITESEQPGVMNVEVVAENRGNVDISPKVRISIMNLLMEDLEEHILDDIGVALAHQVSVLSGQFNTEVDEESTFLMY